MSMAEFSGKSPKVKPGAVLWFGLGVRVVMATGAGAEPPTAPPVNEPSATEPANPVWTLVPHDGRDYVTAREIATFYRFDRFNVDGWSVWFRSPTLVMRLVFVEAGTTCYRASIWSS
jgi:hypothetical protein